MAVKVFNLSTCSDVHRLYVNNMNPLDTRNLTFFQMHVFR